MTVETEWNGMVSQGSDAPERSTYTPEDGYGRKYVVYIYGFESGKGGFFCYAPIRGKTVYRDLRSEMISVLPGKRVEVGFSGYFVKGS